MRRIAMLAFWLGASGACTPLGYWLYEEPAFEVARVRVATEPAADSTVLVGFYVWNPNDYDLQTTRLDLRLTLDGKPVGHFRRDSIIPMSPSETTTLSLPFIPDPKATPGQLAAFRSGTHRFRVEGVAVFLTPFGDQQVRVAHAGDMAFGGETEPVSGSAGSETGPGLPTPNRWPAVWRDPYRPRPMR